MGGTGLRGLRYVWLLLVVAPIACTSLLGDFQVGSESDAGATGSDATVDVAIVIEAGGETSTAADAAKDAGRDSGFDAPPPCGHAGEQCCVSGGCIGGYGCDDAGTCQRIAPTDWGTRCDSGTQCQSHICAAGPGYGICTGVCGDAGDCLPGAWTCSTPQTSAPSICQCNSPQLDVCDGKDNDCNGLIDDPQPANQDCRQRTSQPGMVCADAGCVCPASAITCSGFCVDPQNDVNNCGRCGHYCHNGGTGCANGACQAYPFYDAGNADISKITTGADGFVYMGIEVVPDAGVIVEQVVRCGNGDSYCPGGPTVVTTPIAKIDDIVQDDPGASGPLYWSTKNPSGGSGGIYGCALNAGGQCAAAPTWYSQSGSGVSEYVRFGHEGVKSLYFLDGQRNQIRTTDMTGPTDTNPPAFYTPAAQHFLVVSAFAYTRPANRLFFMETGPTSADYRLATCLTTAACTGAAVVDIENNLVNPGTVAVDTNRVYWTDRGTGAANGRVVSCPLSGCTVASKITYATTEVSPAEVVTDGGWVFWTANNAIRGCPVAGCPTGGPTQVWTGSARVLAVDATTLYWVQGFGGVVMRVAKP